MTMLLPLKDITAQSYKNITFMQKNILLYSKTAVNNEKSKVVRALSGYLAMENKYNFNNFAM